MKHVLYSLVALAAATIVGGCATFGRSTRVEDPYGRFAFSVSDELVPIRDSDADYSYWYESIPMVTHIVTAERAREDDAVTAALARLGVRASDLTVDAAMTMGEWKLFIYHEQPNDSDLAVAYQFRGGTAYMVVVVPEEPFESDPPGPIMRLVGSFMFTEAAGDIWRPQTTEALEHYIRTSEVSEAGAVSISVRHKGDVVYEFTAGELQFGTPATGATRFNWGSITKIVTAMAIMQQVERGAIDLDDPVGRYVPELHQSETFTVRHLLTHSSGIAHLEEVHLVGTAMQHLPSLEETLEWYVSHAGEAEFDPGSHSVYNNWGFLILGVIVERVTGEVFEEYVSRAILIPTGLEATSFRPAFEVARSTLEVADRSRFVSMMNEHGKDGEGMISGETGSHVELVPFWISPAWGGLIGTADNVSRLGDFFLSRGRVDGTIVLSPRSVRSMLRSQPASNGQPLGHGLAWYLGRDQRGPYFEHHGGGPGINTLLWVYPNDELAIAVVSNYGRVHIDRIAGHIADLILE